MNILKFGGTSVGTAGSIRNVKDIISSQGGEKMIVLSAMSGVTNDLVESIKLWKEGNREELGQKLKEIRQKHIAVIEELFPDKLYRTATTDRFGSLFVQLENCFLGEYSKKREAEIVTFGETFLTFIFSGFMEAEGIQNTLLNSKDFMFVDNLENPDTKIIQKLLKEILAKEKQSEIYIAQGFVCVDHSGINTLKRGGSDYTATIIAAAIEAREVQIWTDIDGFHNNDPRYVEGTSAISHLTFEEAAELAYFGAKILHPQTVSPVKEKGIPIYLKNTFTPNAVGTKISSEVQSTGLKAISAKDGITAIRIKSNRMLMAHGFLKKIFEVFDKHETAIDMITTSEIAISLTIDDTTKLEEIREELDQYGEITVDRDHSIICVVGEGLINDKNAFRIFELLNAIQVRMISYGGSNNNISLLVDTSTKVETLRLLNNKLFREQPITA